MNLEAAKQYACDKLLEAYTTFRSRDSHLGSNDLDSGGDTNFLVQYRQSLLCLKIRANGCPGKPSGPALRKQ